MAPPQLVNAIWPNWIDVNEATANSLWSLQDQSQLVLAGYSSLITASQNLSCMALYSANVQRRGNIVATPVSGAYCTNLDQLVIVVQSSNGQFNMVIPGPLESIFRADGSTLNLGDARVLAWWSAAQAVLGDPLGAPWTGLIRGYRRKITI